MEPLPRSVDAHPVPCRVPPSGTVTFLLSDIEGSTAHWERIGDAFGRVLAEHHRILRRAFERHNGYEANETGDSFLVAFCSAADAVRCAVAGQRGIAALQVQHPSAAAAAEGAEPVASSRPLLVRMALYTGEVEARDGHYYSVVVHRASRVLAAAHGGQILCGEATTTHFRDSAGGKTAEDQPLDIPDADLCLREVGLFRLRDVPVPQRLFQVFYPGMPEREFPSPNAAPAHVATLPPRLTRFFGRSQELQRLEEMLVGHAARLVTLTGPGGTGKTRLAIEAADRLAVPFCGAVWYVPLLEVADARLILAAVMEALRLPRVPDIRPLDAVTDALSRQRSLLVLDNFEQLTAGGAAVVRTLLEETPSLQCLVTSRRRLNLHGERVFLVSPLKTPNGTVSVEALGQYESVQLFLDRVQAARPEFHLTPANASAVAALCDRLEGIPLALELAAARAHVLSCRQMLGQLAHRFDFLAAHHGAFEARHHTLRAAMDWSYQLLAPELQGFFRRLSVFRGGWTLEAAAAVSGSVGEFDVLSALQELQASSLIVVEETVSGTRFRLLETLREYAAEALAPEERESLQLRHAEFYLALAERAGLGLKGRDQAALVTELELELDNLRCALEWARKERSNETPARLALALYPLLYHRGSWAEAQSCLERELEAMGAREGSAAAIRARSLGELAGLAMDMGNLSAAQGLAEQSLALHRAAKDQRYIAEALNLLGVVAVNQGNVTKARPLFEEVLRLRPDEHGRALALHNLAWLAARSGAVQEARRLYEEALIHRRAAGDVRGEAETLQNLGVLAQNERSPEEAEPLYRESLKLYRTVRYPYGIAMMLNNLAELAELDGKLQMAVPLFIHSERMLAELHSQHARVPAEALQRLAQLAEPRELAGWRLEAELRTWDEILNR